MINRFIIVFLLIFQFLVAEYANGSSRQIQMQEETITIHVDKTGHVKTAVDFIFKGEIPKGFKMGFPENGTIIYEKFQAFLGTRQSPVERVFPPQGRLFDFKVERYPSAYTFHTLSSMSGQIKHKIRYEYDMPYYFEAGSKGEDSHEYFIEYIVKTGALWDAKIEKIRAFVHLDGIPCKALKITATSLKGKCIDEHTWMHESLDTEPKQNIELILDEKYISTKGTT